MDKLYDVIIIGGGPGGYSAALYCARAGLETLVLEKLSPGGQMATTYTVENYPGISEGIEGFDLAEKMQQGAEKAGAQSEFAEAITLDTKAQPKKISTSDGDVYAKAVIIATGASPGELGLPGEKELRSRGVSYCATCDGMQYKGKTVAIVGGGDSAAADAMVLSKLCKKVTIIHRGEKMRASESYFEPLKKAGNIEIILNTQIDEILRDDGFKGIALTDKATGKKSELLCDGLFIAIGRSPDTAIVAGQVDMNDHGYIVADETTKTSVPGIFAVGDVRTKPLRQIVTAAADGAVASMFAETYIKTLSQ